MPQEILKQHDANQLFQFIEQWAFNRGLLNKDNSKAQMLKVVEEVGETCSAMLKNNEAKIKDGIGDSFVTLIVLSRQLGYDPIECLNLAYNEIKDRTGKMENGSFIKD